MSCDWSCFGRGYRCGGGLCCRFDGGNYGGRWLHSRGFGRTFSRLFRCGDFRNQFCLCRNLRTNRLFGCGFLRSSFGGSFGRLRGRFGCFFDGRSAGFFRRHLLGRLFCLYRRDRGRFWARFRGLFGGWLCRFRGRRLRCLFHGFLLGHGYWERCDDSNDNAGGQTAK